MANVKSICAQKKLGVVVGGGGGTDVKVRQVTGGEQDK